MLRAAWTAAELLTSFQEHIDGLTLIPGHRGVFEVTVNGDLIYSKKATGKFPELSDLKRKVADMV